MMKTKIPPPCDQKIYDKGQMLFWADTSACRATGFETYIVNLRQLSEVAVDWHYVGGRAVVRYLGGKRAEAILRGVMNTLPCPARIMGWARDE